MKKKSSYLCLVLASILIPLGACTHVERPSKIRSSFYPDTLYSLEYDHNVILSLETQIDAIERYSDARVNDFYKSFGFLFTLMGAFVTITFFNTRRISKKVAEEIFEKEKKEFKTLFEKLETEAQELEKIKVQAIKNSTKITQTLAFITGERIKQRKEAQNDTA